MPCALVLPLAACDRTAHLLEGAGWAAGGQGGRQDDRLEEEGGAARTSKAPQHGPAGTGRSSSHSHAAATVLHSRSGFRLQCNPRSQGGCNAGRAGWAASWWSMCEAPAPSRRRRMSYAEEEVGRGSRHGSPRAADTHVSRPVGAGGVAQAASVLWHCRALWEERPPDGQQWAWPPPLPTAAAHLLPPLLPLLPCRCTTKHIWHGSALSRTRQRPLDKL